MAMQTVFVRMSDIACDLLYAGVHMFNYYGVYYVLCVMTHMQETCFTILQLYYCDLQATGNNISWDFLQVKHCLLT